MKRSQKKIISLRALCQEMETLIGLINDYQPGSLLWLGGVKRQLAAIRRLINPNKRRRR